MEKNTVIAAAGTSVSGGGNLYPNTLYKVPEEVRKKSSSAKPELADKVAPACFLYAVFFTFCLYRNASGLYYQKIRYFLERRAYWGGDGKPSAGHFKLFHRRQQDHFDE